MGARVARLGPSPVHRPALPGVHVEDLDVSNKDLALRKPQLAKVQANINIVKTDIFTLTYNVVLFNYS